MTDNWYYTQDGKNKIGPVPFSVLQQHAASGALQPTHMVLQDGDGRWMQARTVAGLFTTATPASSKSSSPPSATPVRQTNATWAIFQTKALELWGKFVALPKGVRFGVLGGGAAGFVLMTCLCCGVFGLIGGGGGSKGKSGTLTARELLLAYTANQKEADKKYNETIVELTGVVQDQGPADMYYGILLEGGTDLRLTLICDFGKDVETSKEWGHRLDKLRKEQPMKGKTVLVRGKCKSKILDFGYMNLIDCDKLEVLPDNYSASAELEDKTGIKTTAQELTQMYKTNKASAATKFTVKVVEVKGVVQFMTVPAVGMAAVGLEGSDSKISVRCYFGVDRHAALGKLQDQLQKGAMVAIKGTCGGGPGGIEGNETVQVDNCIMVEPAFKK